MLIVTALAVSLLAACGSGSKDGNGEEDGKVTINWAHQWGEDHFWEHIGDELKEAFPDVNINVQEAGTDHVDDLEQLVASKNSPDIVTMGKVTHANFLDDLGLAYDMDETIEETGFDLDRLEPSIVEYTRNQDPEMEGRLLMIPNERPTWSLIYNKDIFDILGVEYPEDGLTWEEIVELAKDLTQEANGVQYRGFDLDVPYDAYTQFSENAIDPETDEVLIAQSEAYRRHLELVGDVVAIPGNYPEDDPASLLHNWGSLFTEGEVAMYADRTNYMDHKNFDIATYPVWEGYEGINPEPNAGAYAVTAPSEHKEVALELIEHLLSDEVQIERSKSGQASVLADDKIHEVFGEDNPDFDGKNVESLFKYEYATGPEKTSKYGDAVLWTAPIEYIESGKDINEFLRVLQEQQEESIREQKQAE